MEELSYKIKQDNAILLIQAVAKVVERIKVKTKELPESKWNQMEELNYLIAMSVSAENPLVALTINKGLISLVNLEVLRVPSILSNLLASISVAKCFEGICYTICNLLRMDLERRDKNRLSFNLRAPQHPLISILNQEPQAWIHILGEIKEINSSIDDKYRGDFLKLMHPFFVYVMCKPDNKVPEEFKNRLWRYLLHERNASDIRLLILGAIQSSNKKELLVSNNILIELVESECEHLEVLSILLAASIYKSFLEQVDCIEAVLCLKEVLKQKNYPMNSCLLILLSKSLTICPITYLRHLLELCSTLMKTSSLNHFSIYLLRSSLLQWLAYTCPLTSEMSELIYELLEQIHERKRNNFMLSNELNLDPVHNYLISNNEYVHMTLQLCILSEKLDGSKILPWLDYVESFTVSTLAIYYDYLCSLLLNENYLSEVHIKTVKLLVKVAEKNQKLTTYLLTLILHTLSVSKDPHLHVILLKTLPKMGVLKENLPAILSIFRLLCGAEPHLQMLAMNLYLHLWEIDNNCYSYLHNALIMKFTFKSDDLIRKYTLTKANILKEIAIKKPESHGRELVLLLSDILNKCTDREGSAASAMALEGISYLHKAGIIDICSTWQELSPRFADDKRTDVILSLCKLMAEFSYLSTTIVETNKTIEEVIGKLWTYATTAENPQIIAAAFESLGMFTPEQFLSQLPQELKFKEYEMSTFGVISIHGSFWTDLLVKSKREHLTAITDFIAKLVDEEISGYRVGVYAVPKGQREPANFNALPNISVVRALGNYLKLNIAKWDSQSTKKAYLQCLDILSRKYKKPLPPMDWCFLQELIHNSETKLYCIRLASKQVKLSGTARRLMENYITALTTDTKKVEEIINVYENLGELCDSIQPIILKPFFETTLTTFLQEASESYDIEKTSFYIILECLQNILINQTLHEANVNVINQVLVQIIHLTDTGSPVFNAILKYVHVLPTTLIKSLNSDIKTDASFRRFVQIRCAVVQFIKNDPLMWLNDVIDTASSFPNEQQYFFKKIVTVLRDFRNSKESPTWILSFLGRIQVSIINDRDVDKNLAFYCKTFLLSIIVLSAQDVFLLTEDVVEQFEVILNLFPQSIVFLLRNSNWQTYDAQIVEWLYFMVNYEETPLVYKKAFCQTIVALKNDSVMQEGSKWMKYAIYDTSFIF